MGNAAGYGKFHGIRGANIGQQPDAVPGNEVKATCKRVGLGNVYGYVLLQSEFIEFLLGDEADLPYIVGFYADEDRLIEFSFIACKSLEEVFDGTVDEFDAGSTFQYFVKQVHQAADYPGGGDIAHEDDYQHDEGESQSGNFDGIAFFIGTYPMREYFLNKARQDTIHEVEQGCNGIYSNGDRRQDDQSL